MVQRASLRRGQVFLDSLDFKRFSEGLGKALADKHHLSVGLGSLMDLAAKAAGFKSMRDLKILAERNVDPDEPAFTTQVSRFDVPDGRWLADAQQQFVEALHELKTSGAVSLVVCGVSHRARQSVAQAAINCADTAKFDLGFALKGDLSLFERTTKKIVVLDRVRMDNSSYLWGKEFAERHRDKAVIMLLDEGNPDRLLSPVNEFSGTSIICLDLEQRHIQPVVMEYRLRGESVDSGALNIMRGA